MSSEWEPWKAPERRCSVTELSQCMKSLLSPPPRRTGSVTQGQSSHAKRQPCEAIVSLVWIDTNKQNLSNVKSTDIKCVVSGHCDKMHCYALSRICYEHLEYKL